MTHADEILDTYRALRAQQVPFWIGGRPDKRDKQVLIKRTAQSCGVTVSTVEAALSEAAAFKSRRSA